MKVAFFNAAAGWPDPAPDNNLLIYVSHPEALPRVDETVVVAGAFWLVVEVVHLVGDGDDYEARVWLRPRR